jgi:hypothetical protein
MFHRRTPDQFDGDDNMDILTAMRTVKDEGYQLVLPQDAETRPEPIVQEPLSLLEAAKTLPAFRDTARTIGWRGALPSPSVPSVTLEEREKQNRVEHIKVSFDEAMCIIERDYDAARKELRNQCKSFDAQECKLRRRLSV